MPDRIGSPVPSSPVGGAGPSGQTTEARKPAGQSIQQNPGHQLSGAPKSNGSSRMSQLRASLPKLNTSEDGLKPKANGNESPISPNGDVFKTALSSPTSSAPSSASPFSNASTPPPLYQSGPHTPGTPMSTHNLVAAGAPGAPGGPGGPGGDPTAHPASNAAAMQAGDATQVMQQMYAQQHQMMLQEVQMKLATSVDSMVSKAADAVGSRIRGSGDGMKEAAR